MISPKVPSEPTNRLVRLYPAAVFLKTKSHHYLILIIKIFYNVSNLSCEIFDAILLDIIKYYYSILHTCTFSLSYTGFLVPQ